MEELIVEDYVNKIAFLEEHIGGNVGYKPLEPFWVPGTRFRDPHKIQGAAKKIAESVGLSSLTFLVTVAKQKKNVAGHIELSFSGNEVFIEVSDDIVDFEDAAMATLSHEIAHKYMQLHGIVSASGATLDYEEEILTDITAVFLGLGKFMLNGCEVERTHQERKFDGVHSITESRKCGYLSMRQLAFVYRLVCTMRGVSKKDMVSNLTRKACDAIWSCECYYDDYFDALFRVEDFRGQLISGVAAVIAEATDRISDVNTQLECLRQDYIKKKEQLLAKNHDVIRGLEDELQSWEERATYDPCLRFLDNVRFKKRAAGMRVAMSRSLSDLAQTKRQLRRLTKKIKKEALLKPPRKPIAKRFLAWLSRS
ncbi:MAG: hypothetical protein ISS79_04095 [Phycisphaerae bacterium]|nr:hypothetical protein [Phycisphaerae bacterium]